MATVDLMTVEELILEKDRAQAALSGVRPGDTFSQMILSGRVKNIMREIEKRHLSAVAAERI